MTFLEKLSRGFLATIRNWVSIGSVSRTQKAGLRSVLMSILETLTNLGLRSTLQNSLISLRDQVNLKTAATLPLSGKLQTNTVILMISRSLQKIDRPLMILDPIRCNHFASKHYPGINRAGRKLTWALAVRAGQRLRVLLTKQGKLNRYLMLEAQVRSSISPLTLKVKRIKTASSTEAIITNKMLA